MVLMRTKPWMPGVEGKIWLKRYQNRGMLDCGHTMPERKKRITLKKTQQRTPDIFWRTNRLPKLMPKRVTERMKGKRKTSIWRRDPSCGILNQCGISQRSISVMGM